MVSLEESECQQRAFQPGNGNVLGAGGHSLHNWLPCLKNGFFLLLQMLIRAIYARGISVVVGALLALPSASYLWPNAVVQWKNLGTRGEKMFPI